MTIENYKLAKEFENDINAKKRIVLKNQVHNYMNLRLPKFYSESGSYYLLDSSDWPTEEQDLAEIKKLIEYLKKNFTFYDEWPFLDQKVKIWIQSSARSLEDEIEAVHVWSNYSEI